jgi:hypothetical protein
LKKTKITDKLYALQDNIMSFTINLTLESLFKNVNPIKCAEFITNHPHSFEDAIDPQALKNLQESIKDASSACEKAESRPRLTAAGERRQQRIEEAEATGGYAHHTEDDDFKLLHYPTPNLENKLRGIFQNTLTLNGVRKETSITIKLQ